MMAMLWALAALSVVGGGAVADTTSLQLQPHVTHERGVLELTALRYASPMSYRPLTLNLFVPAGDGPHPVVVFVHGGAWLMDPGNDGLTGSRTLAALAARGYVVARVSYRLSGEARFPAAVTDVKEAIKWLRRHAADYGADPARFAVWGASAGAYLASMVGVTCGKQEFDAPPAAGLPGMPAPASTPTPAAAAVSSCVNAVVSWFGPTDFSMLDRQALPGATQQHNEAGSPESNFLGCVLRNCPADLLQRSNPVAYVSKQSPAFLLVHGSADRTVAPGQSQLLYDALRAKGVTAELQLIPGADHVFAGLGADKLQSILDATFQFIDKQLAQPSSK